MLQLDVRELVRGTAWGCKPEPWKFPSEQAVEYATAI